jgi:hypothetical protein
MILASAFPDRASPVSQKFFASFFQKRRPFFPSYHLTDAGKHDLYADAALAA